MSDNLLIVRTAQVWPIQSNSPSNVLHTFRPPIFSIFSTYRPPSGSNIYLRPTFRPPIAVRPTSIYQQIYNTRSTTTSTPINITTTALSTTISSSPIAITTTTTTTTSVPTTTKSPQMGWQTTNTLITETSSIVSQTYTKRPFISNRGL